MVREEIRFSVIIPIYNVEKFLGACLSSVFNQTYKNMEIICVEDCSLDNSKEILYAIMEKHPEIRLIENKHNLGLSASRNIGIREATGDYILFLDSDDMLKPYALKYLYDFLDGKNVDIIYYDWDYVDEEGNITGKSNFWDKRDIIEGKKLFIELMSGKFSRSSCAAVYRRGFILKNNLFFIENILHEDRVFFFECIMEAESSRVEEQSLYEYRRRGGSITCELTRHRVESMFIVLSRLISLWEKYQGDVQLDNAIRKYLYSIFIIFRRYQEINGSIDELSIGSEKDKFLFSIVCSKKNIYSMIEAFSDNEVARLRSAKRVWIYGAGQIGYDVLCKLKELGITPNAFFVSELKKESKFKGYDVVTFSPKYVDKDDIVIIGVGDRYYKEIYNNLVKSIPNNIVSVTIRNPMKE